MSEEKDLLFLKERIRRYYQERCVEPLPSIERREFAFFQFGSVSMHRGIGFASMDQLRSYLIERVPKHCYYSSAYYDNPTLPIAQREWQGADLIFDLDADHLKGAKELSYEEMLQKVKERFIYLIDEFILGDLGFDEKDLHIVFSGGRGYHLHIRRKDVLTLKSKERREIVDYITGRGVKLFEEKRCVYRQGGRTRYDYILPAPENGWKRRVRECVRRCVSDLTSMSEEEGGEYLLRYSPGTDKKTLKHVLEVFRNIDMSELDSPEPIVITTKVDITEKMEELIRKVFLSRMAVDEAGETDEPVTSDIKRVIRIPGSVHGGSGLIASTVPLNQLKGFNPLDSCLLPMLSDTPIHVRWKKKMSLTVRGERFSGEEGEESELPEWCAFILIARGTVTLS